MTVDDETRLEIVDIHRLQALRWRMIDRKIDRLEKKVRRMGFEYVALAVLLMVFIFWILLK